MKRKTRWGLLIAGLFLLFSFSACSSYGAGSSSPSRGVGIVTVHTTDAESLFAAAVPVGAWYKPIDEIPVNDWEHKKLAGLCTTAFTNAYNMIGGAIAIGFYKKPGAFFRCICMSSAPPNESFAEALCKRMGRELSAIRPEEREVDCKLPLPPVAESV